MPFFKAMNMFEFYTVFANDELQARTLAAGYSSNFQDFFNDADVRQLNPVVDFKDWVMQVSVPATSRNRALPTIDPAAGVAFTPVAAGKSTVNTATPHGFTHNGEDRVRLFTTGTLPAPLQLDTDYYVNKAASTTKLRLFTNRLDAFNNANAIVMGNMGSGVHRVVSMSRQVVDFSFDGEDCDLVANTITVPNHGIEATAIGEVALYGDLPAGLFEGPQDYSIVVVDANTIQLATAPNLALQGQVVDLQSLGAGIVQATYVKFPNVDALVDYTDEQLPAIDATYTGVPGDSFYNLVEGVLSELVNSYLVTSHIDATHTIVLIVAEDVENIGDVELTVNVFPPESQTHFNLAVASVMDLGLESDPLVVSFNALAPLGLV